MHANTTTAPATPATTTTITATTPAEKLSEAQMLVASAFRRADDEANDLLTWGDRDRMCRSLNDALRLMREVREAITFTEPDPIASCLNCGAEEFADQSIRGECRMCAHYNALANAF
jgi:hypothetical protein